MAKTQKNTVTTEASKSPSAKADFVEKTDVDRVSSSETDLVKVRDKRASDTLAAIQVALSLNTSGFSDQESVTLKKGSVARYREFAPADPTESLLVSLAVGLHNATMRSLENVAGTDMLDVRSEELRNATRGTKAVADLMEALDRHRGRGKQSVTVGQVTVETGGQAIVGNVNSEARRGTKPEETETPNDDPPREKP